MVRSTRILRRVALGYVVVMVIVVGVVWARRNPTSGSEQHLRDNASAYVAAVFNDGFAMEDLARYVSARCGPQLMGEDGRGLLQWVRTAQESIGSFRVHEVLVRNFAPPHAEVNVLMMTSEGIIAGEGLWAPYVFEDGQWRNNDC